MTDRYAIYAMPPAGSPLWLNGSSIIGFDAATGSDLAFPPSLTKSFPDWADLTADPRRYGFHGTLKAPFRLAQGRDETALIEALKLFCATRPAFAVDLEISNLGAFFALTPSAPHPILNALARSCVEDFDAFRAPLTQADRARRNPDLLTTRQRAYLDRWGYPYVFEEFRFHMTLTGPVPPERREAVHAALGALFADRTTLPLGGLGLFHQPAGAANFILRKWVPFG